MLQFIFSYHHFKNPPKSLTPMTTENIKFHLLKTETEVNSYYFHYYILLK